MTPAQIKKAELLLAKKQEMLTLRDRHGRAVGTIGMEHTRDYGNYPVLRIDAGASHVPLPTLERWIKQAKAAAKKGII